jgi:peptidoglycan/LPS O-acetylase OafA/YrhL
MKRFQSIQIMRGIAASMVMLYHFGYSNSNFLAIFPSFGSLFKYGDLGVGMFFVISGFVIPYAMHSTTYRINDNAWPFFIRRIVRLEPAYIVSPLLAFVLTYAAARTPGYHGPSEPSLREFLPQFVYLAPWFDVPWLNAWTLAIEFQFYLFMLLAAPLLLSGPGWPRVLLFGTIALRSSSAISVHCFTIFLVSRWDSPSFCSISSVSSLWIWLAFASYFFWLLQPKPLSQPLLSRQFPRFSFSYPSIGPFQSYRSSERSHTPSTWFIR